MLPPGPADASNARVASPSRRLYSRHTAPFHQVRFCSDLITPLLKWTRPGKFSCNLKPQCVCCAHQAQISHSNLIATVTTAPPPDPRPATALESGTPTTGYTTRPAPSPTSGTLDADSTAAARVAARAPGRLPGCYGSCLYRLPSSHTIFSKERL